MLPITTMWKLMNLIRKQVEVYVVRIRSKYRNNISESFWETTNQICVPNTSENEHRERL